MWLPVSKSWTVSISYQVPSEGERLHKGLETEERDGEREGGRDEGNKEKKLNLDFSLLWYFGVQSLPCKQARGLGRWMAL